MSARVELFTTSHCRHCVAVRQILAQWQIPFIDHRLDLMPLERERMHGLCGKTSVPQIFIDGIHVGGSDALMALEANGELSKLRAG